MVLVFYGHKEGHIMAKQQKKSEKPKEQKKQEKPKAEATKKEEK